MKVSFSHNEHDIQVLILGKLGLSTSAIAARVGITEGQVQYRLGLKDIKRRDYRNGTSPVVDLIQNSPIWNNIRREVRD